MNKAQKLNKQIEKLVQWKKQIDNMIAELQREVSAIELEAPQWINTIESQQEPETEVLTGVKFTEI